MDLICVNLCGFKSALPIASYRDRGKQKHFPADLADEFADFRRFFVHQTFKTLWICMTLAGHVIRTPCLPRVTPCIQWLKKEKERAEIGDTGNVDQSEKVITKRKTEIFFDN